MFIETFLATSQESKYFEYYRENAGFIAKCIEFDEDR